MSRERKILLKSMEGNIRRPIPITEPFLKGPVPMGWLEKAASLGGKSLHVGTIVWHLVGLSCSKTVKLTKKYRVRMGVSDTSLRRALDRLEGGGLIKAEHRRGVSPRVTVLGGIKQG